MDIIDFRKICVDIHDYTPVQANILNMGLIMKMKFGCYDMVCHLKTSKH